MTAAVVLSMNVSASIISADWQTVDDNLITIDTSSGLEWLDITATTSRSYNDINSKLGPGQEFDGWRYASSLEISGFWDAFGGDNSHYDGWSIENNGLFDAIAPYWGDAYCQEMGCSPGEGYLFAIHAEVRSESAQFRSKIFDDINDPDNTITQDYFKLINGWSDVEESSFLIGHALVRVTDFVVPVPAAMWLFGSGLIGLIGVARRKKS
jgi:hypothetical protein